MYIGERWRRRWPGMCVCVYWVISEWMCEVVLRPLYVRQQGKGRQRDRGSRQAAGRVGAGWLAGRAGWPYTLTHQPVHFRTITQSHTVTLISYYYNTQTDILRSYIHVQPPIYRPTCLSIIEWFNSLHWRSFNFLSLQDFWLDLHCSWNVCTWTFFDLIDKLQISF